MSVNKVILKGRLGQDPVNNKGVVKFSLATSEKWKDKDGNQQEKTQWHNVVSFGKQAEVIEKYLKKGMELVVIGKLEYNKHEDKFYTSVILNEFDFVSNGKQEKSENQTVDNNEDLPF